MGRSTALLLLLVVQEAVQRSLLLLHQVAFCCVQLTQSSYGLDEGGASGICRHRGELSEMFRITVNRYLFKRFGLNFKKVRYGFLIKGKATLVP